MKNLRFVIGAAIALTASTAFAQVTNVPSFGTSDLLAIVINQTTGATEVVDLGVLPTAGSQNFTVDPSLVGAGTIVFEVVAADMFAGTGAYKGTLWATTASASPFANLTTAGPLKTANASIDNYLLGAAGWVQDTSNVVNGGLWYTTSIVTPLDKWTAGTNLTVAGLNLAAAPGTTLNLFSYTAQGNASAVSSPVVASANLGTFSLVGSTLSFTAAAVSSVPVPAALWLLASGVLGLGATRRRRVAA
jgi:hypothetical protein